MIIKNEKMYLDTIDILSNKDVIYFCFDSIINCFYDIQTKKIYTICDDNIECDLYFNFLDFKFKNILFYDYKKKSVNNIYDLNTYLYYFYNQNIDFSSLLFKHKKFYGEYIYYLIPPTIIEDIILDELSSHNFQEITDDFISYNNVVNEVCGYINSSGIYYDNEIYFSNLKYNNVTGRPSNSSNNINWMALQKNSDYRKNITSRFTDGILIQFDYSSFHFKIIADLINYYYDYNDNMHYKLAKEYFNKEDITSEEYEIAKSNNFKLLYGYSDSNNDSEFIRLMNLFIDNLYKKFVKDTYIETYFFKRKIKFEYLSDVNPKKIFNYYIQSFETEYNLIIMNDIIDLLSNYNTKLMLYTYDSFLFDFDKNDGEELLHDINNIISQHYMCSISVGNDYDNLSFF